MQQWDTLTTTTFERGSHDRDMHTEDPLPTPVSFPAFPYPKPYSIQIEFMQQLFECIDQRKVGIFESPTGTGKSLSMICGAVSWLIDHERAEQECIKQEQKEGEAKEATSNAATTASRLQDASKPNYNINDSTPDWVQQHRAISDVTIEREKNEQRRLELEARVQKIREREKKMRENMTRKMKRQAAGLHSIHGLGAYRSSPQGKMKKVQGSDDDEGLEDEEFLLDEYDSDDNRRGGRRSKNDGDDAYGNISKEVLELLKSFDAKETAHGSRIGGMGTEDEDQESDVLKIYYCSRTHSQLSQFIDELRKTSYGDHLHVVSLGSRKTLCINDRFRQKASHRSARSPDPILSVNKLNDACLDAQKSGTSSEQRCEFLHLPSAGFGRSRSSLGLGVVAGDHDDDDTFRWRKNDFSMTGDEKLLEFRDNTLARVRDIEELAELGAELETCPYYGSRQTVRHCQLVTLPYNLLLHASTRESLKLAIKDNILLLDEAHNLINSLLQMHSVVLSLQQIILAQEQLQVYLSRYEKRLSSNNEGYIRVLIRILSCLQGFVEKWKAGPFHSQATRSTDQSAQQRSTQEVGSWQAHDDKIRMYRPVDRVMKVNEFLHDAGMDHINLFKAHAYLETSGVARKLQGLHESLQRKEAKRLAKEEEKAAQGVKIHQGRNTNIKATSTSQARPQAHQAKTSTTPVLLSVDAFLMSLLNADNDGRVIVAMEDEGAIGVDEDDEESEGLEQRESALADLARLKSRNPVLKFMLLNPANVFKPLVEEARSVVLAGGTMEPVSDLLSHLFPYLKSHGPASESHTLPNKSPHAAALSTATYPRIHRFSCGHVIPKENLMTLVLEKAPTGVPLELNFANRNQDQVMDAIGQSLVNVLNMIPDGVVVFFVSYAYMAQVLARWQQKVSSTGASILERIQGRKRVFVEPREASDADRMLKEYQECILARSEYDVINATGGTLTKAATVATGPRGAVLFSVVGGKMSEGINFSDRLGRGVIVVGMPFPNKGSPELQERMRYMDQVQQQELQQQQKQQRHSTISASLPQRMTAGSEYYENLCMRAVNQSIGRAIRHQNDYAVIVLLDRRYGVPRIRKKLPGWIGSSIEICEQFGPAMNKLSGFFRAKRNLATKAVSS